MNRRWSSITGTRRTEQAELGSLEFLLINLVNILLSDDEAGSKDFLSGEIIINITLIAPKQINTMFRQMWSLWTVASERRTGRARPRGNLTFSLVLLRPIKRLGPVSKTIEFHVPVIPPTSRSEYLQHKEKISVPSSATCDPTHGSARPAQSKDDRNGIKRRSWVPK